MQVERRQIRVMLVEDHNLVRAGIRAVIDGQSDIQVMAEATDGREAIRLAAMKLPVKAKFVSREGDLFEGQ